MMSAKDPSIMENKSFTCLCIMIQHRLISLRKTKGVSDVAGVSAHKQPKG